MSLNKVIIEGKIPFDLELKNGNSEEKKAFLGFLINTMRDYKDADGNNIYDDIYCKAFGPTAEFIARNFEKGKFIIIEGRLYRDSDTTDDDGNKVKGRLYVTVDKPHFCGPPNGNGNGNNKSQKTAASTEKKELNPLRKKSNLLKKK